MSTETTTAILNWSGLQGALLEGGYEVEECLSTTDLSASFRLRILGDRFTKATVRFFALGGISNEQFAIWTDACTFPQSGLSKPIGVGQKWLDGQSLQYAMFAQADETLADVLEQRALTPDEIREIVRTAVDALGGLHSRGYVHSCLSPKTILSVGDSILLSTFGLRRISRSLEEFVEPAYLAPESHRENLTPEADIWCLGASVYQAFTQKAYDTEHAEEVLSLPSPFHAITSRCLDDDPHSRCSLSAVRAMLRGEQLELVKKIKPPVTVSEPVPLAKAASAAAGESSGSPASTPVVPSEAPEIPAAEATKLDVSPAVEGPPASSGGTSGSELSKSSSEAGSNGSAGLKRNVPTTSASIAAVSASLLETQSGPVRSVPRQVRPRIVEQQQARTRPFLPPRPDPTLWENSDSFPSAAEYKLAQAKRAARIRVIGYLALALVVVSIVFWLVWPPSVAHPASSRSNRTGAEQANKQTWPAREIDPNASGVGAPPAPVPSVAVTPPPSIQTGTQDLSSVANWRVVAYTANHEADAQRRASQIASRHPEFSPEVFSPSGGSPYLVVLGGLMTRDDAVNLRRKLRASGFPRDTYVQNFSH